MSLRARLAAAFFVILLAPAVLGGVLLARALVGPESAGAQDRLDHAEVAVRTMLAAECDRLAVEAAALATQAAARGWPDVAPNDVPPPWALCPGLPPSPGPAFSATPGPTLPTALAARADVRGVRDVGGAPIGYAYAVVPLDAAFLQRLSAAAGVTVTLRSTGGAVPSGLVPGVMAAPGGAVPDLAGTAEERLLEPGAGQPLPLVLSVPPPAPGSGFPVVLATAVAACLASVGIAWRLARTATRPLDDLAVAVARVADGDLDTRSPVRGRDELARLGAGVDQLIAKLRDAQLLSVTDSLTGLWNVRHLNDQLRLEVERASRFGRALGVLALDLDRFKEINDRYGHRAGDTVLVEFAERIRGVVREVDLAFRQGGEEFVILLPETDAAGSVTAALRLGGAIRGRRFTVGPRRGATDEDVTGLLISVTVSIGVAVYPDHADTGREVLDAADEALYAAKAAGRDTYVLASPRLPQQRRFPALVDKGGASGGTATPRSSRGR